jgi:hypothetical protein
MLQIGDVYIKFKLLDKHSDGEGYSVWQMQVDVKSNKYNLSGTFLVYSDELPLERLLNIGSTDVKENSYKSTCEGFLFSKAPELDFDALVTLDICIDSKNHDITNRSVITCGVDHSEIKIDKEQLIECFSKIV